MNLNDRGYENIDFYKILFSKSTSKIKLIKLIDFFLGTFISVLFPRSFSKRSVNVDNKVSSLLIIRPGGIGDAALLLPILYRILIEGSAQELVVLCEKRNASVFSLVPSLKVYCWDSISDVLRIRRMTFDVGIDTEQWHYASAIALRMISCKKRIGFSSRICRDKYFDQSLSYKLTTYEYNQFIDLFSLVFDRRIFLDKISGSFPLPLVLDQVGKEDVNKKHVSISLGASHPEKRLSYLFLISLIEYILKKGYAVSLFGGNDVIDLAVRIELHFNNERIENLVGKLSLLESFVKASKAQLFLTADTGLLHLMSTQNIPIIAFFGPTNIAKWWDVKRERSRAVSLNLPCSPCSAFGYFNPTCSGSYKCMNNLSVNNISNLLDTFLR